MTKTVQILEDGKVTDVRVARCCGNSTRALNECMVRGLMAHISYIVRRSGKPLPRYHVVTVICETVTMKHGFGKTAEGYAERLVE